MTTSALQGLYFGVSVLRALRRARSLVSQGWHPTLTLTHRRTICDPSDEAASFFSLHDALMVGASGDVEVFLAAEQLVTALAEPSHAQTLHEWELNQTQREVVALLDRATARALALARGARA